MSEKVVRQPFALKGRPTRGVEERLVVRKELVLREEIWITKTSRTEVVRTPVRLRAERAEVEQTSNLNSSDQRIADHE